MPERLTKCTRRASGTCVIVRPERFRWYRLPAPLYWFLGWAALSIIWSQYRFESVLGVIAQLATTAAAVSLAFVLSWHELLRTLASSMRWLLGLSFAFELWVSVFIGHPITSWWVQQPEGKERVRVDHRHRARPDAQEDEVAPPVFANGDHQLPHGRQQHHPARRQRALRKQHVGHHVDPAEVQLRHVRRRLIEAGEHRLERGTVRKDAVKRVQKAEAAVDEHQHIGQHDRRRLPRQLPREDHKP